MNEPVYVAITREVKPGCEEAYERALHEFIHKSLSLSGEMAVQIIHPPLGSGSHRYGVIRRFADRAAIEEFRSSPAYLEWSQIAADLTEGSGRVEELCGLESWFTSSGQPLPALPPWKMAIATYLGVVPVTLFLTITLERLIGGWNFVLNNIVFNAFVIALLTWVVMPLISRALRGWLRPAQERT